MISIEKAQELVDCEIANDALRKHVLAVSEIKGALADRMSIGEQEKQKQRGYNGVRRRTRVRAKRILHARAGGTSKDK